MTVGKSMFDALAHEQQEVMALSLKAAEMAMAAAKRSQLLLAQIEKMAAAEREAREQAVASAQQFEPV